MSKHLCTWVALLSLFAPAVSASDGVLEINQTCALTTGCFDGDLPGFPVTLANVRAYRLTSDLIAPLIGGANTTLIEITADDVDLDLNGFGLRGFVSCTGSRGGCSTAGAGRGVNATGAGVSIHDGFVTGMGSDGIFASQGARLRHLTARENAGNGIFASVGSVLESLVASENGGGGIVTAGDVVVRDSTARHNASHGFSLQSGSSASGLLASFNGGHGVLAASGSEIAACTAIGNEQDGVHVASFSTIRDCTTRGNGGAGVGASGSENLGIGLHSTANDGASVDGEIVYQDSYLGCSSGPVGSVAGGASLMVGGASSVLFCAVF